MKKQNTILITITLITFLTFVAFATYAFFSVGNLNTTNITNLTATSERNNMVFDVVGGAMSLNVTASNMSQAGAGNVASENNTTLTVSFQANTQESMVCSYDIIFEWTSSDKYQAHTSGVTDNEFIIGATLTNNSHVNEGNNIIGNGTDLSVAVGNQTSATVVEGAEIDSTGTSTSTATWTLTSKFYNVDANQNALSDKTYEGRFKVANVSCIAGTKSPTLVDFLTNDAPRSGTDAVSSSPWILTSDHTNELRYAGKNPDNYIQFNGELWRIIGVMPNMTYCTGIYKDSNECNTTSTGSLVKILRNQKIGNSLYYLDYKQTNVGSSTSTAGSNDWSDSQTMLMLNGPTYLKTGYDVNNNQLHTSYTVTNNMIADSNGYIFYDATYSYLDGNGTTVYKPSSATTSSYSPTSETLYKKIESSALSKIATTKWYLYGTSIYNTSSEGSPQAFYNKERNINGLGAVYTGTTPENRPIYWYGKIGLIYPSDYGYATNGGSTYNRSTCLGYQINGWSSDEYKTDCAGGSYMWYTNITSSFSNAGNSHSWTITPNVSSTSNQFLTFSQGQLGNQNAQLQYNIRPCLYLRIETVITGGTGKWNDPYTIK